MTARKGSYFWDGDEATHEPNTWSMKIRDKHLGQFCVDMDESPWDSRMRYGKYSEFGWAPVPLKDFPKEFRVHLLLLGVT
jgi:hypothetical protein